MCVFGQRYVYMCTNMNLRDIRHQCESIIHLQDGHTLRLKKTNQTKPTNKKIPNLKQTENKNKKNQSNPQNQHRSFIQGELEIQICQTNVVHLRHLMGDKLHVASAWMKWYKIAQMLSKSLDFLMSIVC